MAQELVSPERVYSGVDAALGCDGKGRRAMQTGPSPKNAGQERGKIVTTRKGPTTFQR